jgi:hypothetical protein
MQVEMRVSSMQAAACRPFVYIGFSRQEAVAYVGQTIDRRGIMGRWTDHLSRSFEVSSFRRRLKDYDEYAFDRMTDLRVVGYDLGDNALFRTAESSWREGVEYLVQVGLRSASISPLLRIISTVRSNSTVTQDLTQRTASKVLHSFVTLYRSYDT